MSVVPEDRSRLADAGAEPCPWCGELCMYIESDGMRIGADVRIGADCEEHEVAMISDENDACGNDFGRTNWYELLSTAVAEWNKCVSTAVTLGTHRGVW